MGSRISAPSVGANTAQSPRLAPSWTLLDLDAQFASFCYVAQFEKKQSRDTLANYKVAYTNLRRFLLSRSGDPASVLPTPLFAVGEWLAWIRDRPTPPSEMTVRTYWAKNRSFFRYLVETRHIADPFDQARAPILPSRVPKARTPAECQRILDTARNYPWPSRFNRVRAVAMLALVLFAGLRRKEVIGLQYLDVDLEQQTIHIAKGKGRGGGKERFMFIAPELDAIVRSYLAERERAGIRAPEFFCSALTKQGITVITLRRLVRMIREASGVPFTLHSLRHSFITQLLRSGVPIHTVSDLAGHTQITTTAGYLRVWDEDRRRAVQGLRFDT
jgi:integrase